jgi:predicted DCC family thiol-disulfide oxidoreductase YuxK
MTRDKVRYVPYQKVLGRYPQVTEKQCQYAVQLILSDGKVFSGAHAVLKALSLSGRWGFCLWLYGHVPLFDRVSEFIYQMVATHRSLLSRFYGSPQFRR